MSQQTSARHFYLPNEACWSKLNTLVQSTYVPYEREDINQHTWAELLRVYLPDHYDSALLQPDQGQESQAIFYNVIVHSHHQIPLSLDWRSKPNVVAARKTHTVQPGPQVLETKRDIIWVECKAWSGDHGADWKGVMTDAIARLHSNHPTRSLYFILNVGTQWLIFYWDPTNPAPAGQHLRMMDADGTTTWDMDSRVRRPPGIDAGHISPENVVYTTLTKSINCLCSVQVGDGHTVLTYQDDLDFLEQCIDTMVNYQGYVDTHAKIE